MQPYKQCPEEIIRLRIRILHCILMALYLPCQQADEPPCAIVITLLTLCHPAVKDQIMDGVRVGQTCRKSSSDEYPHSLLIRGVKPEKTSRLLGNGAFWALLNQEL